MTSTHPPVWWKGPLGPLTSGRDLCGDLHETICRVVRRAGEQEDVRAADRFGLRVAVRFGRAPRDPAGRV